MALDKHGFLAAKDRETIEVDVPGGSVFLRAFSGSDREDWDSFIRKARGNGETEGDYKGLRGFVLSRALCDASGARLFTDDEADEIVASKSAKVIDDLFDRALRLSGLLPESVSDAEKNFESGPNAATGSS